MSRIGFTVVLACMIAFSTASAFGPSTMYTSPNTNPSPGSLYPRVLTLKHNGIYNGRMLATFERYVNGTPTFPIYESTNGGVSWTQISQVADTVNGWGLRYQPFLFELPQAIGSMPAGTILCFGNSIPNNLSQTKLDLYKSTDRGQTWTFVSSIASGGAAHPNGQEDPVWEPFALVYNNKLIVYYADERDPNHNQKLVHQTSTDGVNWGPVVEDIALGNKRPGMPVIAKLGNGNYIYTYEYGGAPEANFAIYYKISSNPENFGAANQPGTVLRTRDGVVPTSSPYVTWLSGTGPNGTIAVSAYSSSDIYLNSENGAANNWTRVSSPVPGGYSRALEPLADQHSLFIISSGALPNGSNRNSVVYGSLDIGDGSLIKRLKSHSPSNYFVRHYEFAARIDPDPIATINDSRFRIVPGLANSSGVSFESVNFPGYYLRHYNYALRLERKDGTSLFNQDATFNRVAGLADSSKSSFQSYNFPTRYIRHYDYQLRIDPISTAQERSDATFEIQ
ncbi:AbfB domain-containing protein [Cohnella hongkongensis]|uniref:AbfB domain-containing protein n=1 Tax=Cohnella hongkongensis TaxID=178337 RepID=A0ABV9FML7_9BACL